MYAVIQAGGKQHKVQPGDVIEVELVATGGESITFQPLLVVDDKGATHVGKEAAKATVTATPVGEQKGEKIKVFKFRPKAGYRRTNGHRQLRTLLEIQDVKLGGSAKKSEAKPKTETKPKAEAKPKAKLKAEAKPKPKAKPEPGTDAAG